MCFLTLPGSACSARRGSYVFCRSIQNSDVVLKNAARRTAVSPRDTTRWPLIIAVIRLAGTSMALASMRALMGGSDGFMNSFEQDLSWDRSSGGGPDKGHQRAYSSRDISDFC